jgi:two-component system CheB/CheR fusion protein
MAFVIVSHMSPGAHSQLAEILSRYTKMSVSVVYEAMPIRANSVYVLFPNADVLVEGFTFKVVSPRSMRNKQVDVFLVSLAKNMGARAIGVILSGYDGDGTEGCRHIKTNGGTVFAQDASAEVDGMPLSVQAAGCTDFVLSPEDIAQELIRIAHEPR